MKIMRYCSLILFAIFILCSQNSALQAQTKLSNLVEIGNARSKHLVGYGLVTGLNNTGDRTGGRRGSVFTVQSIASMLNKFGINVDPINLRTRNVAAVMVTAELSAYNSTGSDIDV